MRLERSRTGGCCRFSFRLAGRIEARVARVACPKETGKLWPDGLGRPNLGLAGRCPVVTAVFGRRLPSQFPSTAAVAAADHNETNSSRLPPRHPPLLCLAAAQNAGCRRLLKRLLIRSVCSTSSRLRSPTLPVIEYLADDVPPSLSYWILFLPKIQYHQTNHLANARPSLAQHSVGCQVAANSFPSPHFPLLCGRLSPRLSIRIPTATPSSIVQH